MSKKGYINRTPFGNTLDTELFNKLKNYSDETGIPMSKILDKAIQLYLDTILKKK